MTHVLEELELYALGAISGPERAAVASHLSACQSCRRAAAELEEVVSRLPEAAPPREPPQRLRHRILSAAAADGRPAGWRAALPRVDLRLSALGAAVLMLLAVNVGAGLALRNAQAERDSYVAALESLSHGGRWWYMAGVDDWTGSGGNLVAPGNGRPAFVLFHDLRELPPGQMYTLWLITPDGGWSRGASFRPGEDMDLVPVGLDIEGFERCAVTVETRDAGRREGPIVMQSRIAAPSR